MMTRGRGGVMIPPKNDDVIYEQPLMQQKKDQICFKKLNLKMVKSGEVNDREIC